MLAMLALHIAVQQKSAYTDFQSIGAPPFTGSASRDRADCLLHLLHWWIQPEAATPRAFF